MADEDKYREQLDEIFEFAKTKGLVSIVVNAGELHNLVWGSPPVKNQMPNCCRIMRYYMREGDEILYAPPSGDGSTVNIIYHFPRFIKKKR